MAEANTLIGAVQKDNSGKSLWVKWLKENRLQRRDIWSIEASSLHPWGWKKILKIRDELIPNVVYNHTQMAIWNLSSNGQFNNRSARALFTPRGSPPPWIGLTRFQIAVPRHIFSLWLALNDGFFVHKNYVRTAAEGCPLCNNAAVEECMDHLLFNCSYSNECMRIMSAEMGWEWPVGDWKTASIITAQAWRGDSRNAKLSMMVLAVLVDFMWKERNCRRFDDGKARDVGNAMHFMLGAIRLRLEAINEDPEWKIAWGRWSSRGLAAVSSRLRRV